MEFLAAKNAVLFPVVAQKSKISDALATKSQASLCESLIDQVLQKQFRILLHLTMAAGKI